MREWLLVEGNRGSVSSTTGLREAMNPGQAGKRRSERNGSREACLYGMEAKSKPLKRPTTRIEI